MHEGEITLADHTLDSDDYTKNVPQTHTAGEDATLTPKDPTASIDSLSPAVLNNWPYRVIFLNLYYTIKHALLHAP